jgi:hypothetical protein
MMMIKLHPEAETFLKNMGSVVHIVEPWEEQWYYMPYWLKRENDHFLIYNFDELPDRVKDSIKDLRDEKK